MKKVVLRVATAAVLIVASQMSAPLHGSASFADCECRGFGPSWNPSAKGYTYLYADDDYTYMDEASFKYGTGVIDDPWFCWSHCSITAEINGASMCEENNVQETGYFDVNFCWYYDGYVPGSYGNPPLDSPNWGCQTPFLTDTGNIPDHSPLFACSDYF